VDETEKERGNEGVACWKKLLWGTKLKVFTGKEEKRPGQTWGCSNSLKNNKPEEGGNATEKKSQKWICIVKSRETVTPERRTEVTKEGDRKG